MDWGTFDKYRFKEGEAKADDVLEEPQDQEVDMMGQMTKFAFDSAIGNLKKVGIVMFIESKLTQAKLSKTCQFLKMKIDDMLSYGNLV